MAAEVSWTDREDAQHDAKQIVRNAQLGSGAGWHAAVEALARHAELRKVLDDESAQRSRDPLQRAQHHGAVEAWNDIANLLWGLYNNGTLVSRVEQALRDQLDVDEATFWSCVQNGDVPDRGVRSVPDIAVPAEVVALLISRVGLNESEVKAMSKDEAIVRLQQFWTEGH